MKGLAKRFFHFSCIRICALAALTLLTLLGAKIARGQAELPEDGIQPSNVCEGSLLYRSPVNSRYQEIPLTRTDAALDVRGLVASATVTQHYTNNSSTPIEAVYVFPLPHDAAVYDMEIRVGDRVIRSVIHERAEAKRVYETAKGEGKRAALLEEERPNIFTASVANIMPKDQIQVRLRYVQQLQWEDGKMRLLFPMTVGPRYIPGTNATGHAGTGWAHDTDSVEDASRITPPVRHPESRNGHDISVSVELDPGFESAQVQSVSHAVNLRPIAKGRQRVELAGGATIPNQDFVLEITQPESRKANAAIFLSPAGDSGETHFLLTAYPPTVQPAERTPVEMLYMIDVSGSMGGTSIEQARAALLQALDRLRPNDRFGVLAFHNSFQELAPEPLQATPHNVWEAKRYVRSLQAGGGTEMLPALSHLMRKPLIPGYLRHIILLTDGDLGNEEQIFAEMRQNLGHARLYAIAIGSEPNLFLATKMAQFGRGTFTHIANIGEVQEQMTSLFAKIESPVLTDVKISFDGVEVQDVFPQRVPDLFLGQPLLVFGRITKGRTGTVHLSGRVGNDFYETNISLDTTRVSFHPAITTLWARKRVEDLMDQWRESAGDAQTDIRSEIVAHAIRYRLVTRFTSLVAVEEKIVNPGGQSNTTAVASELPEGMQMDKVFGAPATGTADAFFEALGIAALVFGTLLLLLLRKVGPSA